MIKPASADCNMRCDYCYYYRNSSIYQDSGPHRMELSVFEKILRQYLAMPGTHKQVSWQGGEPLLAGLDFFKKAIELQHRYAKPDQMIENSLQTNGLLINDDWARFFAMENFLVGISLDGPEQIHDCYRRDAGTKLTYTRVMHAINILNKYKVDFNILIVVAKHTVDKPEKLLRFFIDNGFFYLQFIPCVEKEGNRYTDFSITAREYGDFLCRLFNEYLALDSPSIYERTIDAALHSFIGVEPPFCVFGDRCNQLVTFEYNGDAFPCDFFVQHQWRLGNIETENLAELVSSERMVEFAAATREHPAQCSSCRWNFTCHGACARYRQMAGDFESPNYFCRSYKKFFEHSFTRLGALVDQYPANRSKLAAVLIQRKNELDRILHHRKSRSHAPSPPEKTGRNDPCPCGSGKKYKRCCLKHNMTMKQARKEQSDTSR